jgi:hypothetical protein
VEPGGDQTGLRFESEIIIPPNLLLHKPGKAARTVAAHFTGATVAVVELPRPIGLRGACRNEQDDAIGSDSAMSIANAHDLIAAELDLSSPVINEHEVISSAIHLGEFHKHGQAKYR